MLVGLVLTVPAFLGLARLLERSRPVIANVSRLAFVPGLVALTSLAGMELVLWQMAQPGRDRVEMVALLESLNESAGIAPLFGFVLLFPVAWLLAGIGLYVARATPVWGAALIALSQPVGFVSESSGGPKWLAVAGRPDRVRDRTRSGRRPCNQAVGRRVGTAAGRGRGELC